MFWAIGTIGAVLFTCFFAFGMFLSHRFEIRVIPIVAFGAFLTWEGYKMFRAARNSH